MSDLTPSVAGAPKFAGELRWRSDSIDLLAEIPLDEPVNKPWIDTLYSVESECGADCSWDPSKPASLSAWISVAGNWKDQLSAVVVCIATTNKIYGELQAAVTEFERLAVDWWTEHKDDYL